VDRQVHACQPYGGYRLFVTEKCHAVRRILLPALYEVAGLDEHAAGAAGRVEDNAVIRLDHVDDGLHQRRRREELTVILRALHGELHQEILVDAAENVASGGAKGFAIEDPHQVFQYRGFERAVLLRELAGQRLKLALDGVHGAHQRAAEILILRQAHQLVVARFLGQHQGAALQEVGLIERALGHFPSRLVLRDLSASGVVAVGGMAEEDDAEYRHAIFRGGLVRVGAQVVRRLPKGCFQFLDVLHVGHARV
jgi:hypothetical protein